MNDFNNQLNLDQIERIALLMEEMGELQQSLGKVLRHGYHSCDPTNPEHLGNSADVAREAAQVRWCIDFMLDNNDFPFSIYQEEKTKRTKTVGEYLHHNKVSKPKGLTE